MSTQDQCEVFCYDEEKVNRLKKVIVSIDIQTMTKMFKALSDGTRMKIAYVLSQEEELCVCDVANIIGSTMATASHHLRLLRNMGLAKYRKEGKLVFYSLDDEHIRQLIEMAHEHSQHEHTQYEKSQHEHPSANPPVPKKRKETERSAQNV